MTQQPSQIGRYNIEKTLGKGAMGVVYKAFDTIIQRHVAIKTLNAEGTEADPEELSQRFLREAQAAGRLNHPGIVAIYDFGREDDISYIAMEYVEGNTLAQIIRSKQGMTQQRAIDIALQILAALQYAHENGVIHRDIKPSNIMCMDSGQVKITDFGIARLESSSELTQMGAVIGTPGYMSPEHLNGGHIDHRSDIFSCGILLYEMLSGNSAFTGTNVSSTMYNIVNTTLEPISQVNPEVSPALDHVLEKALAKKSSERLVSAKAFAAELNNIATADTETDHPTLISDIKSNATPSTPESSDTIIAIPSEAEQQVEASEPALDNSLEQGTLFQQNTTFKENKVFQSHQQDDITNPEYADNIRAERYYGPSNASHELGNKRLLVPAIAILSVISVGAIAAAFMFNDAPEKAPNTKPAAIPEQNTLATAPKVSTNESTSAPQEMPTTLRDTTAPTALEQHAVGSVFSDCDSHCPTMVVIPAGQFVMGSPLSEFGRSPSEGPRQSISIEYEFALSEHEVTRREFAQFVESTGYQSQGCTIYQDGEWFQQQSKSWQHPGFLQNDLEPVTCISWDDARAYVAWLAKQTQQPYRLPTAAEWEYVARAGTNSPYPWGYNEDFACEYGNVADQYAGERFPGWLTHDCVDGAYYTRTVTELPANPLGVRGLIGNVFEWVEDCWQPDYRGWPLDGKANQKADCAERELKGGSWFSQPQYTRPAYRNHFPSDARSATFGIRVARTLSKQ